MKYLVSSYNDLCRKLIDFKIIRRISIHRIILNRLRRPKFNAAPLTLLTAGVIKVHKLSVNLSSLNILVFSEMKFHGFSDNFSREIK